jgi:hypothetical protein
MNNRIKLPVMELAIPVGKHNQIEISTQYTLGGINYFSCERYSRGYRVSFQPCSQSECGRFTEYTLLGSEESGFYIFVEAATRFNRKKLEAIHKQVEANKELLVKLFSTNRHELIKVVESFSSISKSTVQEEWNKVKQVVETN